MNRNILIPAVLTTSTSIRIFPIDGDTYYRRQTMPMEWSFDNALEDGSTYDHENAMKVIRAHCKGKLEECRGCPGEHFLALKKSGDAVGIFAYQIVETTSILDDRTGFRHKNGDVTTETVKLLSKKIFIFGRKISKSEGLDLVSWTEKWDEKNRNLPLDSMDVQSLESHRCSPSLIRWNENLQIKPDLEYDHFIKIGAANMVPFDPETMEFRPFSTR